MRSTRLHILLISVVAFVLAGLVSPVAASAAPYCGIYWGSLAKQGTLAGTGPSLLTNVRAGRHECYDRLVLDLRSEGTARPATGWRAQYVAQVPLGETGRPLPMRGGAFITIRFTGYGYDPMTGVPTYAPANVRELVDVSGYRTFRKVALADDFEGVVVIGLGVRARLPFRVFTLVGSPTSPSGARLVIDVAHRW